MTESPSPGLPKVAKKLSARGLARRQRLAERDGGMRCAYCRVPAAPEQLVLEHVIPYSQLGPNDDFNRVLACQLCDRAKGGRTPQQWQPGVVWDHPILDNPTSERRPLTKRDPEFVAPKPAVPAARVLVRDRGRRTARLRAVPFADLGYCATCQVVVDRRASHPRGHLIIDNGSAEPGPGR